MTERLKDATGIQPHPYACQIDGCKGRIGQAIVDLGEKGALRVCLYHDVLLKAAALEER